MINPLIYVDSCNPELEKAILDRLGIPLLKRMDPKNWNVNDALTIICDPRVVLAVINQLDEISVMEIALLHFMCKPILVTHNAIKEYPIVEKTVDYVDLTCNLKQPTSSFINWYTWWEST